MPRPMVILRAAHSQDILALVIRADVLMTANRTLCLRIQVRVTFLTKIILKAASSRGTLAIAIKAVVPTSPRLSADILSSMSLQLQVRVLITATAIKATVANFEKRKAQVYESAPQT